MGHLLHVVWRPRVGPDATPDRLHRQGTAMTPVPLCDAKLYRCCGEGPLRCEKPAGHEGPHEDEGVVFG